ncbi:MAG: tetratricopeptide repeat protein [Candidatus Latescibacteria bacterium]|nr:tetratricopeptide repeat protein [Candidatus Latescibacterota bacterium]
MIQSYSIRAFVVALVYLASILSIAAQQPEVSIKRGKTLFEDGQFEDASAVFRMIIEQDSKRITPHYWLGLSLHAQGESKEAVKSLKKAVKLDRDFVDAHVVLAQIYLGMDKKKDARKSAEKAIKANPETANAHYYLALARDENVKLAELRRGKVKKVFENQYWPLKKAISLDPQHTDAHYRIGRLYIKLMKDPDSAIPFFVEQASINPEHTEALLALADASIATERFQEGVEHFQKLAELHGGKTHPLVVGLSAQLDSYVYLGLRREPEALKALEAYLIVIKDHDPEAFRRYRDISLVAEPDIVKKYGQLTDDEKEATWRQFWAVRDPDPTTAVNERLSEHYRRVMFALRNFSDGKEPWDTRGEIYIRYGEPDDRQSFVFRTGSNVMENYMPSGDSQVDAVRETNRYQYQLQVSNGASPWSEDSGGFDSFLARSSNETRANAFATESWVYVPYNLELFFTDQMNDGSYDYPLLPTQLPSVPGSSGFARSPGFRFMSTPKQRVASLIKQKPEAYDFDYGGDPLNFVYDLAAFRGNDDQTEVEVAFSVPTDQMGIASDGSGMETWFASRVALQDAGRNYVAGSQALAGPVARPMSRPGKDRVELRTAGFSFTAPAGTYRSALAVKDSTTKRIGIFLRPFTVKDFSGANLHVSDIKLAAAISESADPGPFSRNGLRIIPHPVHIFAVAQPIYIYFELYNLTQNGSGQTEFDTGLTIAAKEEQRNFAWQLLTDIGRLVTRSSNDQAVDLAYEDGGLLTDDFRHTSIDTSDLPPGPYTLTLTVTDRQTGEADISETDFVIAK